jgi:uncharacterized protein (TIGR02147 family)
VEKVQKSVFNYTDYRKFLIDFFDTIKSGDPEITYAHICKETGIKSPGHLSLILHGKANISIELAERFSTFCKLKSRESRYFLIMIQFNQEKKTSLKTELFEQLISFNESCICKIGPHHYKFYDKWYHSAIRALLEFISIKDNFEDLAKIIVPTIRPDQVKGSIVLLSELGLIQPDSDGFYRPTQKSIETGSAASSLMLNNFTLSMLNLAGEAMDRFSRNERIFSSITIGIDKEGYDEIVAELREFRRRVAEIAQRRSADRIIQVNFQAFPLSKIKSTIKGGNGDE